MEDPSAVTQVSKLQEWERAALVFFMFPAAKEQPATAQQHLEPSWSGGEPQQPTLAPGSHPAQLLQAVAAEWGISRRR